MINVQDFGAAGDGIADDAPAIQNALDQHRDVFIPYGRYNIGGTLKVHSGTRLTVHPHTVLKLADGAGRKWNDFLLTNAKPESGDRDIEICGGIWNGNQKANRREPQIINPGAYGGVLVNFFNVENLLFRNLTLANAESYFSRFSRVRHFLVENIRFQSDEPRPNNDGVHLGGDCEHGLIRHLRGLTRGAPNDDIVALNADDALDRVECYGQTCGPIRHVHIYDLEAVQCHTFVRMLSVDSPIEHITIDDVRGGCDISAINMDAARGCLVPLFDENDPARQTGVGAISHARASRFMVHKTERNDIPLLRLETRAAIIVTDFRRDPDADVSPEAPTLRTRYIENHEVAVEGLNEEQKTMALEHSSAQISIESNAHRHNLGAKTTRGESLVVPGGDLARVSIRPLL